MKNSILYDWHISAIHSWLSVDIEGHVAFVECAVDTSLPNHINIPLVYLVNLFERLVAFSYHENRRISIFHECEMDCDQLCEQLGIFHYKSMPEFSTDGHEYRCVWKPSHMASIRDFPISFQTAARYFSLADSAFAKCDFLSRSCWRAEEVCQPVPEIKHIDETATVSCFKRDTHDLNRPEKMADVSKYEIRICFYPNSVFVGETPVCSPALLEKMYYNDLFNKMICSFANLHRATDVSVKMFGETCRHNFCEPDFETFFSLEGLRIQDAVFYCRGKICCGVAFGQDFERVRAIQGYSGISFSLFSKTNVGKEYTTRLTAMCQRSLCALFRDGNGAELSLIQLMLDFICSKQEIYPRNKRYILLTAGKRTNYGSMP